MTLSKGVFYSEMTLPYGPDLTVAPPSTHSHSLHAARPVSRNRCPGGFPSGAVVKNPPANAGDTGSSPGREDPTCHGATEPVHHNY